MLSTFSGAVGEKISRFALLAYLLCRLLMPGITNSKNKFHPQNLSLGKEACCPVPTVAWRADSFYTGNDVTCYICLKLILVFKATLILITLWSRVLPEKFPEVYGTQVSLRHSQAPSTCLYPEPEQCSSCLPVPQLEDSF
jgi:hypothetical protein